MAVYVNGVDTLAMIVLTLEGMDGEPIPNPGHFRRAECGRSSSELATAGVSVTFNEAFVEAPRVATGHWQKETWITEVTTAGFTWRSEEDSAILDWIAVGEAAHS